MNDTARRDGLDHERLEAVCGGIWHPPHPDPANAWTVFFSCYDHESLGLGLSAAGTLFFTPYKGFVHLHTTTEPISSGSHHRPPQLV